MLAIIYHPCVKQITYYVTLSIRYGISKENTAFNFNSMFKLTEKDKIWLNDVALYCMTFVYIMAPIIKYASLVEFDHTYPPYE